MENHFDLTDEELASRFSRLSLNPELFNHEAHLRLAWIHIGNYGVEQAIDNICTQLWSFVYSVNASEKYNKTLTIAAVRVVDHFMRRCQSDTFAGVLEEFPQLKTHFRELISTHYSFDIFNLEAAKRDYLEPDLMPFM
jgi:hypothetical protein